MGWRLGRMIHVMDRGFSSEENLRILQRGAGHYIIGERMQVGKKDVEVALSKRGRFHKIRGKPPGERIDCWRRRSKKTLCDCF